MSQAGSPQIQTACPGCSKQYVVPATLAGRQVKCETCQHVFVIASAQPRQAAAARASQPPQPARQSTPAATSAPARQAAPVQQPQPDTQPATPAATAPRAPAAAPQPASSAPVAAKSAPAATSRIAGAGTGNCAICQSPVEPGEQVTHCPACAGAFHTDCWEYNHGCGVYGCAEAPPTEGLNTLEIPASHWGQEHKQCPNCAQVILAAAKRCKHCGATFESANPQDRANFHELEANKAKLPAIKVMAIVLLVVSILPCTAPFAAIGGPIWYMMNRKSIAMLPGFHAALCKIAVGVSIVVTTLLFVFTIASVLKSAF